MDLKEAARNIFALIDQMQAGTKPWSTFDEVITSDFRAFVLSDVIDVAAFKAQMQTFGAGFTESSHTVYDLACEGDTVMVRELWQGKQTGAFLGVEPTNQHVQSVVFAMLKFENGKVKEFHEMFDSLKLMRDAGVMS